VKPNDGVNIGVKGAVETILDFCTFMSINGEIKDIDKNKILANAEKLAKGGYQGTCLCQRRIQRI
jgi:magnesium-transporting ATPase (P-type)